MSRETGGQPFEVEQNETTSKISKRANSASEKIKSRIEEAFISTINEMDEVTAERWIDSLQNDFYKLVEDPDDECGGGNYKGWTTKEIEELFFVLYGEEME